VATASGEAPARRRRGRGRKQPSTPTEVGTSLLRARQAMGLGLADVRDRTGVSVAVLEALETGDLSQAPSLDGARTGLRRYADLVGLDGDALARSLDPYWGPAALVGATGGAGPTAPGSGSGSGSSSSSGSVLDPSTGAGFAGHLRRYPGEGAHLQAFTQTAEVPSVGSPRGAGDDPYGSGQVFGTTGMFPATPPLHIRRLGEGLEVGALPRVAA